MFHLFQSAVEMRLCLLPKKGLQKLGMRNSMVSSCIEVVALYKRPGNMKKTESNNFSSLVTFKLEIEKNHKRNWIKTCLFTG